MGEIADKTRAALERGSSDAPGEYWIEQVEELELAFEEAEDIAEPARRFVRTVKNRGYIFGPNSQVVGRFDDLKNACFPTSDPGDGK